MSILDVSVNLFKFMFFNYLDFFVVCCWCLFYTDTPLFFDRFSPIPCLFNATLCVFRLHCPCLVECLSSVAWLRSRSCVFKCLGGKSAGESQTRPGQASEKGLASL